MQKTITPSLPAESYCYGLSLLILLLFGATLLPAQSGCPGCSVELSDTLPEDTFYLDPIPDGKKGQYYEKSISFRLPKTTTPVAVTDPEVIPGLPIDEITILSVANLPAGLSWEADKSTYLIEDGTDGCIRLCGVPLESDSFEILVELNARISFINAPTTVDLDMMVAPSLSQNSGFTLKNHEGCGQVVASFENNVPSNGAEGYSYQWNFGNGNSSNEENPTNQIYSAPGTYAVEYQAIIDTVGFILKEVRVEDVGCNDFGTRPDIYIRVLDPSGKLIYQSPNVHNTNPPLRYVPNLKIGTGKYTLEVMDEDKGIDGTDDICTIIELNQNLNGSISGSDWRLFIDMVHPVDTIRAVDSVRVYALPEDPVLESLSATSFCAGDSTTLTSSYAENIVWYRDGEAIAGANKDQLIVRESGSFQVAYTTEKGCMSFSAVTEIQAHAYPDAPVIDKRGQTVLCEGDTVLLLSSYGDNNQWFRDGEVIEGASGSNYKAYTSGSYQVAYTSPQSCTSFSEGIDILVNELPEQPIFSNDNNQLVIDPDVMLPEDHTLQWFLDGDPIMEARDTAYCSTGSGTYGLLVIDNATGCINSYELEVTFDANFDCLSPTSVDELDALALELKLFPNPFGSQIQLSLNIGERSDFSLRVLDLLARPLYEQQLPDLQGQQQFYIDAGHWPAGIYLVQIQLDDKTLTRRIVKRN